MNRFVDQLKEGDCRFIVGEAPRAITSSGHCYNLALYCAEPATHGSYCAHHHALTRTPGTARVLPPPREKLVQRAPSGRADVTPDLCDMLGAAE